MVDGEHHFSARSEIHGVKLVQQQATDAAFNKLCKEQGVRLLRLHWAHASRYARLINHAIQVCQGAKQGAWPMLSWEGELRAP